MAGKNMGKTGALVHPQALLPQRRDIGTSGKDPYPDVAAKEAKDGRPWKKCCEECAFFDSMQRDEYLTIAAETDTHFYCVHREDKGEHRVCAGFAAYQRAKNCNRVQKAS